MAEPARAEVLVLGVGNVDRGDDGVGRIVAQALRVGVGATVEIGEVDGEATGLLQRIAGRQRVIIVDACVSGAAVGAIHRFDAAQAPLPTATFGVSSHGLGLPHALELARALGGLPARCEVYAIEGVNFAIGAPISPPVAAAGAALAKALRAEFDGGQRRRPDDAVVC